MHVLRSPLASSATIRLAQLAIMVLASIVLPRYIGPEKYGLALAIFAVPAIAQGLLEVAIAGLPLQKASGDNPLSRLGTLPPVVAMLAASGVWAIYGYRIMWMGLAALIAFWWVLASILMAQAHHERRHLWVAASYGAMAGTLGISTLVIIAMDWRVEEAYLGAVAAMYYAGAYTYTLHPHGRRLIRTFKTNSALRGITSLGKQILTLAGPRAFTTTVMTGFPMMAVIWFGPSLGAQFKVAMVLSLFASQVIPVHPLVVQGEIGAMRTGVRRFVARQGAIGLTLTVVIGGLLYKSAATAIPVAYGDEYRDAAHLVQVMVIALPMLFLFQLGTSTLIGIGRGRAAGFAGWTMAVVAIAGVFALHESPEAMTMVVVGLLTSATILVWAFVGGIYTKNLLWERATSRLQ